MLLINLLKSIAKFPKNIYNGIKKHILHSKIVFGDFNELKSNLEENALNNSYKKDINVTQKEVLVARIMTHSHLNLLKEIDNIIFNYYKYYTKSEENKNNNMLSNFTKKNFIIDNKQDIVSLHNNIQSFFKSYKKTFILSSFFLILTSILVILFIIELFERIHKTNNIFSIKNSNIFLLFIAVVILVSFILTFIFSTSLHSQNKILNEYKKIRNTEKNTYKSIHNVKNTVVLVILYITFCTSFTSFIFQLQYNNFDFTCISEKGVMFISINISLLLISMFLLIQKDYFLCRESSINNTILNNDIKRFSVIEVLLKDEEKNIYTKLNKIFSHEDNRINIGTIIIGENISKITNINSCDKNAVKKLQDISILRETPLEKEKETHLLKVAQKFQIIKTDYKNKKRAILYINSKNEVIQQILSI